MIEFGPFRYDAESRFLYRGDEEIMLPPRVLAVLESLLKRPGKVVTKDAVLESAWEGAFVGEDSLTQAVSQLRSALGDDPQRPTYIQTIPKRGYRFIAEVSEALVSQGAVPPPTEEAHAPPPAVTAASTLAAGATVGSYELLSQIGAGAMGEVWRALDTELQRDVAIKVVPQELAGEAAVIERFRREALMLAAVNHPNIATIFRVEEVSGIRFIVMELLDGETLQERIKAGALATEDALNVAIQIARALEVAHDAGIVHRDLKPANIIVNPKGHVKVLDFGLAKDANLGDGSASVDPTLLTTSGLLIGTAAYMSPEQAAGKSIDKRSDIFSFGCVLFEMLAGQRPFAGDGVSEIVAAILRDQPNWDLLPPGTPGIARALLRRCLRKDPERRLHDIADARIEIDDALAEPHDGGGVSRGVAVGAATTGVARVMPWVVAAAAIVAAVAIGAQMFRANPEPHARTFEITFQGRSQFGWLSPDGSRLASWGPNHEVVVHDLETGSSSVVFEDEDVGGVLPRISWSPDGTSLAISYTSYLASARSQSAGPHGRTVVVPLAAGPARVVLERLVAVEWDSNDSLVFPSRAGLERLILADGQVSVLVETPASGEPANPANRLSDPRRLPDGNLLYAEQRGSDPARVMHFDGARSEFVLEVPGGRDTFGILQYADGFILVSTDEGVMALPFDLATRSSEGASFPLAPGATAATVSTNGTLIYFVPGSRGVGDEEIVQVSRTGQVTGTLATFLDQTVGSLRLSPDGNRLALVVSDRRTYPTEGDVWVYEMETGAAPLLLPGDEARGVVGWMPGGDRIGIARASDLGATLSIEHVDGSVEPLAAADAAVHSLSPDGRHVVFSQEGASRGNRHPAMHLTIEPDGTVGSPEPLARDNHSLDRFWVSPNGRWMAFFDINLDTDTEELWVASFPDGAAARRIADGRFPAWARQGDELFFIQGDPLGEEEVLMAVPFDSERGVPTGAPSVMFPLAKGEGSAFLRATETQYRVYDIAPDAESFVFVRHHPPPAPEHRTVVVENWTKVIVEGVRPGR